MKIIHVYAYNLQLFEDAIKDTGCKINGSHDVRYLRKSLTNFNARDVLGLIIYRRHLTRKLLKLIKYFDNFYYFNPLPVIVVADDAVELVAQKRLKTKRSPLFVVNSLEGTISDVDINRIFTTLACMSGDMYELREVERAHSPKNKKLSDEEKRASTEALADSVLQELERLGGIE